MTRTLVLLEIISKIGYYSVPVVLLLLTLITIFKRETIVQCYSEGRIKEFDFIRAVSAVIIILFHYSCIVENNKDTLNSLKPFYMYANGDWGTVAVNVFFVLSGALLYHRHSVILRKDWHHFYYRRLQTIFPSFWILWGYLYLQNVIAQGKWLYAGSIKKLLLSLIGLDGYFYYQSPNYYLIGEWFLGAIIICYILYPVLSLLINRMEMVTTIIFIGLFLFVAIVNPFQIMQNRNIITCLFMEWIGMLLMKHQDAISQQGNYTLILMLIICCVLYCVKLPYSKFILNICFSISLFVLLWKVSGFLISNNVIQQLIMAISGISYQIFLVHHVVLYDLEEKWREQHVSYGKSGVVLLYYIVLIFTFSEILAKVTLAIQGCVKGVLYEKGK